ncbi:hypothetical protein ZWY2020_034041 [Hordeum vulgare]|nr:hypothetical protein ZWY2020_034041 [Hordeum vulgare]
MHSTKLARLLSATQLTGGTPSCSPSRHNCINGLGIDRVEYAAVFGGCFFHVLQFCLFLLPEPPRTGQRQVGQPACLPLAFAESQSPLATLQLLGTSLGLLPVSARISFAESGAAYAPLPFPPSQPICSSKPASTLDK